MNYKVVRELHGGLVCFGPNDENYGPSVKEGQRLNIEDNAPEHTQEEQIITQRAGMVCTRLQGRLTLGEAEIARLDAFIDSFPNNWSLRQVVDNAVTWRRNSQDMVMLGFALNYSPDKMDETFIRAMAIEV